MHLVEPRIRQRRWATSLGLPAVLLLVAGCAHAPRGAEWWPTEIREYVLPDTLAFPNDVAVGADGRVWYTDRLGHRIGRLDPETGVVEQWPTPTEKSAPYGVTVDSAGWIWYAASRAGRIGRVDPATAGITEWVVDSTKGGPHDVVAIGDRVWFTLRRSSQYGVLDPRTGEVRKWPLEQPRAVSLGDRGPYALARSRTGDLWFTVMYGRSLYRVDTRDGSLTEVPLPGGWSRRLAVDRAGVVWYSNFAANTIGRVQRDGTVAEVKLLRTPAEPYGIAVAPDGRIWFNESRSGLVVGWSPATQRMHAVAIPTPGATVRGAAVDTVRHRLWLPLSGTHRIGRMELKQ